MLLNYRRKDFSESFKGEDGNIDDDYDDENEDEFEADGGE
jgi:hypothetical protein